VLVDGTALVAGFRRIPGRTRTSSIRYKTDLRDFWPFSLVANRYRKVNACNADATTAQKVRGHIPHLVIAALIS
jgi:hypothetical protein